MLSVSYPFGDPLVLAKSAPLFPPFGQASRRSLARPLPTKGVPPSAGAPDMRAYPFGDPHSFSSMAFPTSSAFL